MFMQVVRGKVKDEAALRQRMDQWQSEVKPGAIGYLGSTAGFLDDGSAVILARFESEELASQNSDRPEQGAWWAETAKSFDGEPEFINVTDVEPWLDGGSDDAGFVQVMIGHSPDRNKLHEFTSEGTERLRQARPEIIGGLVGSFGDDGYVNVGYFTSESEARKGEATEPPEDMRAESEEFQRLMGDCTYLDIHEPILMS
jgi:hypothetical protein